MSAKDTYYQRNKEEQRRYQKEYRDNNRHIRKQWEEKNKQKLKEYNKRYGREYHLDKMFGITLEQYNELFDKQSGCCAICGKHQTEYKRAFDIDHDHSCCKGKKSCGKCIRGLLCADCNKGLGLFKDAKEILEKAIKYIK